MTAKRTKEVGEILGVKENLAKTIDVAFEYLDNKTEKNYNRLNKLLKWEGITVEEFVEWLFLE